MYPPHERRSGCRGLSARPGDPHHGRGIDPSAASRHSRDEALIGGRWRNQEDPVQTVRIRNRDPLLGLVRGEVWGDRTCATGGGKIASKPVCAVALDQVPISHHDRRCARTRDGLHGSECVPGPYATLQRLGPGALDGEAIHHGVAVGHTDLDEVDPLRLTLPSERLDGLQRDVDCRVTDREEARQPSAALCSDLAQQRPGVAGGDAHRFGPVSVRESGDSDDVPVVSRPNQLIAVSTSLSPRPERLIKINGGSPDSLVDSWGGSLSAPARAWADSRAGTIPSVRDSSWKASIASASVIDS